MAKEIWRDIKGYEGIYQVSNLGRIKGLEKKARKGKGNGAKPERVLKPYIRNSDGYSFISLSKLGKVKKHYIHRLVAVAFISNPKKKPCINHINGIKDDNKASNLEWCTYSENEKHSRIELGKENPSRMFDKNQIFEILSSNKNGVEMGKELGVCSSTIVKIRAGISYKKYYYEFYK